MCLRVLLIAALIPVVAGSLDAQSVRQGRGRQMLQPQGTGRMLLPADSTSRIREGAPQAARTDAHTLLAAVEEGLADADVSRFSLSFASTTSLNLSGGESGTFSANQAHYVLQNYLRSRRLVGLSLAVSPEGDAPYGSGTATLHGRGGRGEVRVFVALRRAGDRLVITQITIH